MKCNALTGGCCNRLRHSLARWLVDAENPDWAGNYKVRYWEQGWQDLILSGPESYLNRITAAGFDGVYLDLIDAFEYFE